MIEGNINLTDIIEKKMDDIRQELKELQSQREGIAYKENELLKQFHAWKLVHQAELNSIFGKDTVFRVETEDGEGDDTETPKDAIATVDVVRDGSGETHHLVVDVFGSRTNLVRQFLLASGTRGVTPKEVSDFLALMQVKVSASFAGNTLHKMKLRGEVVPVADRYVLTTQQDKEKGATEVTP